jgi:hypothetical protein
MPCVDQQDVQGIGNVNHLSVLIELAMVYVETDGQTAHGNGLAKAIQHRM